MRLGEIMLLECNDSVNEVELADLKLFLKIILVLLIIQNLSIYILGIGIIFGKNLIVYFFIFDIVCYLLLSIILIAFYKRTAKREYFISALGYLSWVLVTIYWRITLKVNFTNIFENSNDLVTDSSSYVFALCLSSGLLLVGLYYLLKCISLSETRENIILTYGLSNFVSLVVFSVIVLIVSAQITYLKFFTQLAIPALITKIFITPVLGVVSYFILFRGVINVEQQHPIKKLIASNKNLN